MLELHCRAAVVSLVLPDGHLAEPAIYFIELPSEKGRPLSDEEALMTIIGNWWVAVGYRIMIADIVGVPHNMDEPPELRPRRKVSAATAKKSPMRLQRSIIDPNHSNYEEFHKYYAREDNLLWEVRVSARSLE